jgi:hypothetical protein
MISLFLTIFLSLFINPLPSTDIGYGITFEKRHIDLGKVKKGEIKTFDYRFVNTGTEDISIMIVSACECSTLDWTKKVIKPSQQGVINVIFDSGKKDVSETVDVDVYMNNIDTTLDIQRSEILSFKFELIE